MNFCKFADVEDKIRKKELDGIPIVLCSKTPYVLAKVKEAGYYTFKVNQLLTEKLVEYPVNERPNIAYDLLQDVFHTINKPILMIDYEMLFDPRYKIDVLKAFCDLARSTPVIVLWCGSFSEDALTYGEFGYLDYHKYLIKDYMIACVK